MKIKDTKKQSVPFQKDQTIEFFKGTVASDTEELYQYSLSSKLHLGKYRMTLSYEFLDIRHMCVFLVDASTHIDAVIAENDKAKEIWENPDHIKYTQVKQALGLILKQHL